MKIRKRLKKSLSGARFVRVVRRGAGLETIDGVVVAVGSKWFAMAVDSDAGFDGFSMIRVRDVRKVRPQPHREFAVKSWFLDGHWPVPRLEGIDLDRTKDMLRTLGPAFAMLAIFHEYEDPDVCYIGVPTGLGRKRFSLWTIDPDAQWDCDLMTSTYQQVSKVDVGGRYVRRLLAVGGTAPLDGDR